MWGITNHERFLLGKFNFQLQEEERGCSLKPPYKRIQIAQTNIRRNYGRKISVSAHFWL